MAGDVRRYSQDACGCSCLGRFKIRRAAFPRLDFFGFAIPGLKVVFPATPYDAKGLMASALNGTDPVIFFESQRLYDVENNSGQEAYRLKVMKSRSVNPISNEPDRI